MHTSTSLINISIKTPLELLLRSCIKNLVQDVNPSISSLFLEIIPIEIIESKKNLQMSYQARPLGRYRYTFKPQKYTYNFHLKSFEIINLLKNKTRGIEKKWIIKEQSLETVRIVTFYIRVKKFSKSRCLSSLNYISYKPGFGFSEEKNFLELITYKKAIEFLQATKKYKI